MYSLKKEHHMLLIHPDVDSNRYAMCNADLNPQGKTSDLCILMSPEHAM